jgi:hypothetical protein
MDGILQEEDQEQARPDAKSMERNEDGLQYSHITLLHLAMD